MTKEFNLSERIYLPVGEYLIDSFDNLIDVTDTVIQVSDVKEFIRRLRGIIIKHSRMHYHSGKTCWVIIREDLKELVGDKLK